MRFQGKKVLVTGAGHGIGLAIAQAFAAEGARVAVNDITTKRIELAVAKLGVNSSGFPGDVADVKQAQSVVSQAVREFGGKEFEYEKN